jgi:mxaJ protein
MTKSSFAGLPAIALVLLCALSGRAAADVAKQLRVCGDPNNLPFSNEKLQGIENKIADVIAKDLGMTVVYA